MSDTAEKSAWIKRVLGVEVAETVITDPLVAFTARLSTMLPAIRAAGSAAKQIQQQVAQAGNAAKQADFTAANALLDQVAASLRPPSGDLVAYRKSLLAFRQASAAAAAQVGALRRAVQTEKPEQETMVDDLADTLRDYSTRLLDAVDDALNASADEAAAVSAAFRQQLNDYAADLTASKLVAHAENNPFGVPVAITSILGTALSAIRTAMPTA